MHPSAQPAEDDANLAVRAAIVTTVQRLDALGLNRGSTGNASCRAGQGMWITPTGMGAEAGADDLCWLGWDGTRRGRWQPSSEWHFHQAIYLARPDVNAVLHTHSPHATALACLHRPLPAFHYMVAVAGGHDVPLVPYSLFGTEALSRDVAHAFAHRGAALLANHGLVAAGRDLAHAAKVLQEVEALCGIYLQACACGEPVLLSTAQMDEVIERFAGYGQRHAG